MFAEEGTATTVDDLGNVVGAVPGATSGGPSVLLAAHLDTVFVAGTPLTVRRDERRLHGPGVGDNSLGVAAILALPRTPPGRRIVPAADILLTGNVGEEGLGNLRGMRAVMDERPGIAAAVAIEATTWAASPTSPSAAAVSGSWSAGQVATVGGISGVRAPSTDSLR
jgi:acetylornithine deacetylase/succinyl-diaminopimelate desuccinylase-like protein